MERVILRKGDGDVMRLFLVVFLVVLLDYLEAPIIYSWFFDFFCVLSGGFVLLQDLNELFGHKAYRIKR